MLSAASKLVGLVLGSKDAEAEDKRVPPDKDSDDTMVSLKEETRNFEGKVTSVHGAYGMIDGEIYFTLETMNNCVSMPTVGCSVSVVAKRKHGMGGWRATQVNIDNDISFDDDSPKDNDYLEVENKISKAREELKIPDTKTVAVITAVKSDVGVLNESIKFTFDELKTDYIPDRGDWVTAIVSVNEDTGYKTATEISPLREKEFEARINAVLTTHGYIEGDIYFQFEACVDNYRPRRGDRVCGIAIETNRGQCPWRATSLQLARPPINKAHILHGASLMKHPQMLSIEELLMDKQGIHITDALDFGQVLLTKDRKLTAWIKNSSKESVSLESATIKTMRETQFSVGRPVLERVQTFLQDTKHLSTMDGLVIEPGHSATVSISCVARNLGNEQQLMVFEFDGFNIGRYVKVQVLDPAQQSLDPSAPYQKRKGLGRYQATKESPSDSWVIPGQRPSKCRPNLKMPNKLPQYTVPQDLWKWVVDGYDLSRLCPSLSKELNLSTYVDRFTACLHLEEIQDDIDIRDFDLERVCLRKCGDLLGLGVPGLAEGRPSVLVGDSIILADPCCTGRGPQYQGIVHEVLKDEVLLKFHNEFHSTYDGADYDVRFSYNRTTLRRCHQAVNFVASLPKSEEVLFPTQLLPKTPQTKMFQSPVKRSSPQGNIVKATIAVGRKVCPLGQKKKDFTQGHTFFNKSLNSRQRSAVLRILNGQSRPTPYILFGPPGTGKTVTVVEAILQIFNQLPSSRILAATPSNSAADLLAERLHGSGRIKVGDMVRLNAYQRNVQSIPECIQPYCQVGDELEVVARHRIILCTCTSAGMLYALALKPGHITHVFVDEAGQATEPEVLIPLGLAAHGGGQVVLAGDPLQLGAVLQSDLAQSYDLHISLLERLSTRTPYSRDHIKFADHGCYDPLLVTKLVKNYRAHSALLTLPSQLFYHGELEVAADPGLVGCLGGWSQLPKPHCPIIFHGLRGEDLREGNSPSWFNAVEAIQIMKYLQAVVNNDQKDLSFDDIGIITPYRKQVEKIRLLIDKLGMEKVKVGSVEEFQGQERLVIMISTVRSRESEMGVDVRHHLGFLSNPKRFNVAITRAQALLIIVGNPHILSLDVHWRALLQYCVSSGAYTGCDLPDDIAPQIPDSDSAEDSQSEESVDSCQSQVELLPTVIQPVTCSTERQQLATQLPENTQHETQVAESCIEMQPDILITKTTQSSVEQIINVNESIKNSDTVGELSSCGIQNDDITTIGSGSAIDSTSSDDLKDLECRPKNEDAVEPDTQYSGSQPPGEFVGEVDMDVKSPNTDEKSVAEVDVDKEDLVLSTGGSLLQSAQKPDADVDGGGHEKVQNEEPHSTDESEDMGSESWETDEENTNSEEISSGVLRTTKVMYLSDEEMNSDDLWESQLGASIAAPVLKLDTPKDPHQSIADMMIKEEKEGIDSQRPVKKTVVKPGKRVGNSENGQQKYQNVDTCSSKSSCGTIPSKRKVQSGCSQTSNNVANKHKKSPHDGYLHKEQLRSRQGGSLFQSSQKPDGKVVSHSTVLENKCEGDSDELLSESWETDEESTDCEEISSGVLRTAKVTSHLDEERNSDDLWESKLAASIVDPVFNSDVPKNPHKSIADLCIKEREKQVIKSEKYVMESMDNQGTKGENCEMQQKSDFPQAEPKSPLQMQACRADSDWETHIGAAIADLMVKAPVSDIGSPGDTHESIAATCAKVMTVKDPHLHKDRDCASSPGESPYEPEKIPNEDKNVCEDTKSASTPGGYPYDDPHGIPDKDFQKGRLQSAHCDHQQMKTEPSMPHDEPDSKVMEVKDLHLHNDSNCESRPGGYPYEPGKAPNKDFGEGRVKSSCYDQQKMKNQPSRSHDGQSISKMRDQNRVWPGNSSQLDHSQTNEFDLPVDEPHNDLQNQKTEINQKQMQTSKQHTSRSDSSARESRSYQGRQEAHCEAGFDPVAAGSVKEEVQSYLGRETQSSPFERKIIRQIEYYFGDVNISKDAYLQEEIEKDPQQWVSLHFLLTFNKLKALTSIPKVICTALRKSTSRLMEVDEELERVRRSPYRLLPTDMVQWQRDVESRAVAVDGIKPMERMDTIQEWMEVEYGTVEHIERQIWVRSPRSQDDGPNRKPGHKYDLILFSTKEDALKLINCTHRLRKYLRWIRVYIETQISKQCVRHFFKKRIEKQMLQQSTCRSASGGPNQQREPGQVPPPFGSTHRSDQSHQSTQIDAKLDKLMNYIEADSHTPPIRGTKSTTNVPMVLGSKQINSQHSASSSDREMMMDRITQQNTRAGEGGTATRSVSSSQSEVENVDFIDFSPPDHQTTRSHGVSRVQSQSPVDMSALDTLKQLALGRGSPGRPSTMLPSPGYNYPGTPLLTPTLPLGRGRTSPMVGGRGEACTPDRNTPVGRRSPLTTSASSTPGRGRGAVLLDILRTSPALNSPTPRATSNHIHEMRRASQESSDFTERLQAGVRDVSNESFSPIAFSSTSSAEIQRNQEESEIEYFKQQASFSSLVETDNVFPIALSPLQEKSIMSAEIAEELLPMSDTPEKTQTDNSRGRWVPSGERTFPTRPALAMEDSVSDSGESYSYAMPSSAGRMAWVAQEESRLNEAEKHGVAPGHVLYPSSYKFYKELASVADDDNVRFGLEQYDSDVIIESDDDEEVGEFVDYPDQRRTSNIDHDTSFQSDSASSTQRCYSDNAAVDSAHEFVEITPSITSQSPHQKTCSPDTHGVGTSIVNEKYNVEEWT